MSSRRLYAGLVALCLFAAIALTGCRTSNPGGDDGPPGDGGPDAIEGPGCGAMSPRTVTPEPYVGPSGLQARLTALIDGADDTLDIHMYLWTVRALADRVVAAKQRGVTVRVILDPDSPGNDAVRPTLSNGGVTTRNATPLYAFSHAKYMLIDGATAVIMSNNFNVDAMSQERNYGIIDRDPDDVADVQALFDMDWALAGGEPAMPADIACTRLIVSPNNAKPRLLALINGATETLELEIMYLSEDDIRAAVGAAAERGVAVRVILGDRQDESIGYLRALGATVKFPDFSLHAKLIVADGVVFVGSENLSLTALTKNRELGALVFEPAAAAVVTTQFEADWASSLAN